VVKKAVVLVVVDLPMEKILYLKTLCDSYVNTTKPLHLYCNEGYLWGMHELHVY
jgi:hypothetical protein